MQKHALYSSLANYYDGFYWWKDYEREASFLTQAFDRYGAKVGDILEVACGTGSHAKILAAAGYRVTGVDISEDVLRVAKKKLGRRASFIHGDMRDLDGALGGRTYDAVICLFSSISYNRTSSELRKTVKGMCDHLRPGGLVAFDTHFTKSGFMDGYRGEDIFDDGRVMGARLSISKREGDVGVLSFSYLISDVPKTILLRDDVHRLGLFNKADYLRAMREAGLVDLSVFIDWRFDRRREPQQFQDMIFMGRRSEGSRRRKSTSS
jgi:SAM-dependent methyltransferase